MPRVTLRQIIIFEEVARYKSHTKAAAKLHMTQPAVSMQMKQFEESLDIHLFEREGKAISLTKEAENMRTYTSGIMQSYRSMMEYTEQLKGVHQGHLVVSVATTANYFTTRILAAFSHEHPQVKISLDVTNREKILSQLAHNEPDQVIMGEPPRGLDLDYETFMDNPLVVIAPPDHHLVGKKCITLSDLTKEKFVGRELGSGTREAIERHMNKAGARYECSLEMSSNEAIKHAVAAGFGLGIVSQHTITMELDNHYLVLLDVEGFPIVRHWHLVTRKGRVMSSVAKAFREYILEKAKDYV